MKTFLIELLAFTLVQLCLCQNVTRIHTNNGLDRGSWGVEEFCPEGSYAASMEILYQDRGNVDDTCVNAIKFYCYTTDNHMVGYITSLQGKFGTWRGIKQCPNDEFIIGYALNLEGDVGPLDDDLGVMDVRAECQGGSIMDGLGTSGQSDRKQTGAEAAAEEAPPAMSDGGVRNPVARILIHKLTPEEREKFKRFLGGSQKEGEVGIWGALATCPTGSFVCGLQTRVEDEHLYDDDAGLCDAVLFCCS